MIVVPAQGIQLAAHLLHQRHAAGRPEQAATTLRHREQFRVLGLPGLPEPWLMPRPVAGVTQPVQLHAEALQVEHGGCVLRMAAQQPHGGETETFAGGRQRVQVIGMSTAQADDAPGAGFASRRQMRGELEPLVAGDQRVDPVQAQDRHFHPGAGQPVEGQGLQGRARQPVERSEVHEARR